MDWKRLSHAVEQRDWETIEVLAGRRGRLLGKLFAMTFTADEVRAWHAIEAIGIASKAKAGRNSETIRDFMRRCIWSMNDESGELGWRSPEIMGEVLYRVPSLIPEYAHLMFHYFDESPFERGAVHAVMRIAPMAPELLEAHRIQLNRMSRHENATIRLLSVTAMNRAGVDVPSRTWQTLRFDASPVTVYDYSRGNMVTGRLCDLLSHRFE